MNPLTEAIARLEAERLTPCPEAPKGINDDGPTAVYMAAEARRAALTEALGGDLYVVEREAS